MSIRTVQSSAMLPRHTTWAGKNTGGSVADTTKPWVRNPSWLAMPAVLDTDQKFVGLVAVFPESSFLALTASDNYTVDWGDGVVENFAIAEQANHLYDYTSAALNGSNAPVTLSDAGDLVTRTAHGYSDGMTVRFYNIITTTGLSEGQVYYVINATTDTFRVSSTVGGVAIALTGDGSAALLPYKQALVTVTPQAGQVLMALNLNVKNSTTGLQKYETGWLDLSVSSPNFSSTGLVIAANSSVQNVYMNMVERVTVANLGGATNLAYRFYAMRELRSVALSNTQSVTSMNSMFGHCYSLQTVPLFNTQSVTNMGSMFQYCSSLQTVPLFDTQSVTSMDSMFQNCYSLQTVPLFNTQSVTRMNSMFLNCSSLQTVPLFNTQSVTNMGVMFQNCYSLQTVPLFNTQSVTDMSYMFQYCYSLQTVPLFNTQSVTNMGVMFQNCFSLQTVPPFSTSAVTSSSNFGAMFSNCTNLARIQAKDFRFTFSVASCKLSATALNEIYTNLPTVTTQTITVTGNYGTASDNPAIATAKGWTVTG